MIENQLEKSWQELVDVGESSFAKRHFNSDRNPAARKIIFPTETVWGLGALANDGNAINGIYNLKGRLESKTLGVMLSDKNLIDKVASPTKKQKEILQKIFEQGEEFLGKLSLVLPYDESQAKWKINKCCCSILPNEQGVTMPDGKLSVSIRIPLHPLAKIILRAVENHYHAPMAVTSVNISGEGGEVKNLDEAKNFLNTHAKSFCYDANDQRQSNPSQFPIIHSLKEQIYTGLDCQTNHPFFKKLEAIVDLDKQCAEDKKLNLGKPSTILSLTGSSPTIKRHGVLEKSDIEKILGIKIQG